MLQDVSWKLRARSQEPHLRPRIVGAFRHYSWPTFAADALAGVTVGFVALPLAMAFAIASGLTPEAGIYCAVVAGGLISLLGGSKCRLAVPSTIT